MIKQKRIVIGYSDCLLDEIISGNDESVIVYSDKKLVEKIAEFQGNGYTVKFENCFIRELFGLEKYRVVAYKK